MTPIELARFLLQSWPYNLETKKIREYCEWKGVPITSTDAEDLKRLTLKTVRKYGRGCLSDLARALMKA